MREAELLDEASQPAGLLDRVEVGALQVLDEAEHKLLVVARLAADDRRHGVKTREPRRAPAALAGDELVAIGQPAYEQRLEHAVQSDRFGELAQRFGVETGADLLTRRPDLVDRDHLRHQSLPFGRHGDEGFESPAESARSWLRHRSSSSFARARYATAPRHVGSYSRTDFPWLGASLRRTLRGIRVSRTWCGCERFTASSTSQASVVRPSNCVIRIPAMASFGFRRERTSWCVYMR